MLTRSAARPTRQSVVLRGVNELPHDQHVTLVITNLPAVADDLRRGAIVSPDPTTSEFAVAARLTTTVDVPEAIRAAAQPQEYRGSPMVAHGLRGTSLRLSIDDHELHVRSVGIA